MAACVTCGQWAGIGKTKHDNCAPPQAAQLTEQDILVMKLAPVIRSAAVRGGVAGAFTAVGLLVLLGFVVAVLRGAF